MISRQAWEHWNDRSDALGKLDKIVICLLVITWARKVLPLFETSYPADNRPRKAIEAAEAVLTEHTGNTAAANAAAYTAHANWDYTYATYLDALEPSDPRFNPVWLSSTVRTLLTQAEQEYSLLPILADALEDAGCDNSALLLHFRQPKEFTKADWWLRKLTSSSRSMT